MREDENTAGEYGYPVLNGHGINPDMIVTHPVSDGERVILCSDGYPFVQRSYEDSEAELAKLLEEDPLLYKNYKSTKGQGINAVSFDDRAWVEIG